MSAADFVHLHTHSQYSLLDGSIRLDDLVAQAKKFKMPALALTDHGNLFGAIEFYQKASKAGVKPIIGCEVYMAPASRFEKSVSRGEDTAYYHLILLVENEKGYRNLMELVSAGFLEGFYYKPRIDKELLRRCHEGLIGLSACLRGEVAMALAKDQYETALNAASEHLEIFGKDHYYLEMQDHGIPDQKKVNEGVLRISKELGIPVVATNDSHYLYQSDARAHEVLLCIQTGKTLKDTDRMKYQGDNFYLKSGQEMMDIFGEIPEAITNTKRIAEQCHLLLDFKGKLHLPHYVVPEAFKTTEEYLRHLCELGLKVRYPQVTAEIRARLEHELNIINKVGYGGYFLIVWDMVNHAKQTGIMVGPGRGSAAGSLVSYVLRITDLDPLKYGLIFERFLNPDRISPPDIDIDFCDYRRGELVGYLTEKYGKENVAQVITFGKLKAKQVIRDVARAMDISLVEADKIAKSIPNQLDITLDKAVKQSSEFKALVESKEEYKELIEISKVLEGLTRHASKHAAGVVIGRDGLINYCPLFKDANKEEKITQYDKDSLEKVGLLKFDLLGVTVLTVIEETLNIVKETRGVEIDIGNIPLEDNATFQMLKKAQSFGVFQLESSGMQDVLRRFKCESIYDLMAVIALFRPGPMEFIDDYIKRKNGEIPVKYHLPEMEEILKETYGIVVYQEQVMQIANKVAGYSMAQADILRKAMGKKDVAIMEGEKSRFVEKAVANKVSPSKAEEIWDLVAKFAGYGFNKSHSAAYAMLAYQTAYLKASHMVEFMAALLSSVMGDMDKTLLYINECRKMKVPVLPPDINESSIRYTVIKGKIRFGLNAVKNVGEAAIKAILEARVTKGGKFTSFYDFCEHVDLRVVNKRVVESFIKAGVFDSLKAKRSQMMAVLDHAFDVSQSLQKDRLSGQNSFFDTFESEKKFSQNYQDFPNIPEWPEHEALANEKEIIGFYLSGHPLAKYEDVLSSFVTITTGKINDQEKKIEESIQAVMGGVILSVKLGFTKEKKQYARFVLEDMEGTIEALVWPETFNKYQKLVAKDAMVMIKGLLDVKGGNQPALMVREIIPIQEARERLTTMLHLRLNTTGLAETTLEGLKKLLQSYPGNAQVQLHLVTAHHGETVIQGGDDLKVKVTHKLYDHLKEMVGETSVTCQASSNGNGRSSRME